LLSNVPQIPLVPVATNANCTNYAQGSSRVTLPFGPNAAALQPYIAPETNIGLMAVPLVTQFTTHLAAHGNYTGKELVTVMAGANDIFMHANAVSAAAAGGAGAVGAAALAGWTSAEQNAVAAGGTAAVNAAATAAVTHSALNAAALAAAIKASVTGKGAKYVVVVNVPSIEYTPFGQASGAADLLRAMVTTFNGTLKNDLAGVAGLLVVDAYTQGIAQYNNPAQYGITNVTEPACTSTVANPNILYSPSTGATSLVCTVSNTLSGVNVSTYFYADAVHPTPAGYKLLDRYVAEQMAKVGWL
jgi:outer membrane lipase/esterase